MRNLKLQVIFVLLILSFTVRSFAGFTENKEAFSVDVSVQDLTGFWYKINEIVTRPDELINQKVMPYEWIKFDSEGQYHSFSSSKYQEFTPQALSKTFGSLPATIEYKLKSPVPNIKYLVLDYTDIPNYQEIYSISIVKEDRLNKGFELKSGDLNLARVVDKDKPIYVKQFRRLNNTKDTK